jgi:hypothetical protein
VSHLVYDKSSRGGDETRYHNIKTPCSDQKTDKIPICDRDREHYPGNNNGKDLSRVELGGH